MFFNIYTKPPVGTDGDVRRSCSSEERLPEVGPQGERRHRDEDVEHGGHHPRHRSADEVVEDDVERVERLGAVLHVLHGPPLGDVPDGEEDARDDEDCELFQRAVAQDPRRQHRDQPTRHLVDDGEVVVACDDLAIVAGHCAPEREGQLFSRFDHDHPQTNRPEDESQD